MNYPYGPTPPPPMQHALMMQGLPPTLGPSYINGRRSSANSSPLQSRSHKNTISESGASAGAAEDDGNDSDHDSLSGIPDVPTSEAGGGGSEKGSVSGSPLEDEPPSAQTA
ncbi:hypothetical protein M407DRAFT_21902 [Tulasnella calospora MUT 4182]|uniref:Uncharacterized protein n=1 Tax=Tulasnella calospora MUT 4182 TaxID=1051891 RepID=A0A0C3QME7_9AGAM|nr:hypothetical protein M407DRAFT_21902 [Tulasnella calospora MUT 4182]